MECLNKKKERKILSIFNKKIFENTLFSKSREIRLERSIYEEKDKIILEIYRDSTSTNELAFKDSVVRLERSNCYFYTKRILLNFRLFVLLNDSCPTNNVCNDGKPILLKRHTEFYYQV